MRLLLLLLTACGSKVDNPLADPDDGPPAGNPDGDCSVPGDGQPEDSSAPDHVVGTGTPASCTSEAVVDAVAQGGVITFDCGPDPVVIELEETAKVFNDKPNVVLDGGGLVTLSGQGRHRILYMNTCDPDQVWTTDHCDDQDHPTLTVQNLTFVNGWHADADNHSGGGAIFASGGRFKAVNTRFFGNHCAPMGSDVGGGAIRVFQQSEGKPVYIVNSTFGGEAELGNTCANGGALSSIGVSWTVLNSAFSHNDAIGSGASDGQGGNGGAIYNDGNPIELEVCGADMRHNTANEGGGAIFFVSNDQSGHLRIDDSVLCDNPSLGFETHPGMFVIADGEPALSNSVIDASCPE